MLEAGTFDRENLIKKLHNPFNREYVVEAFEHLILQLGPLIHEYDTIIGDDVSGRLPTLVIADLARKKRSQMELPSPQVFFINAGSNVKDFDKSPKTLPLIRDLIKKHASHNRKILIVTEYVATGDSISILADEFRKQNLKPDLCILDSSYDPIIINSLADYKIFLGVVKGGCGGQFHNNPSLTGLHSVDYSPTAAKYLSRYLTKDDIVEARRDMKLLANYLWQTIE
jgi:hypothetical protein